MIDTVRKRWLQGAAVVAGAAAVWALEMRWVGSYAGSINTSSYWAMYSRFGADRQEIITTVLTRPDKVLLAVFWPPEHLAPLVRVLAGMAFLPLTDLPAMLFLLVSIVHNLLQPKMHLHLQNEACAFGPLVFAMVCGLARLAALPRFAGAGRVWLVAAVLATAGWGLRKGDRVLTYYDTAAAREAPELVAMIPPTASLWTDAFLAAPLSARRQIKAIAMGYVFPRSDILLFRPEYVFLYKITLIAMSPASYRESWLGFLAREGYQKIGESRTLLLLRDPRDAVIHNNLGAAYLRSGRREDAQAAFEQALRLNPTFQDARDNLAKLRP